jgi:5-methylcytosine-specific restriction endonuclease McrA
MTSKLMQKWASKPYCSKVPGKRLKHTYECHQCNFCGSVVVIGGSQLTQSKEYNKVFCDIECANQYKKWHNKTPEYQKTIDMLPIQERKRRSLERQNNANRIVRLKKYGEYLAIRENFWTCCAWCFVAFKGKAKFCSQYCDAKARYMPLKKKPAIVIECERCGKEHITFRRNARFCSERCRMRSAKSNREHLIRSMSGVGERISLRDLMKAHRCKCCQCGVKCKVPDGHNDEHEATVDHIVPLSKGGLHIRSNVQLMCRRCNYLKNDTINEGLQLMLDFRTSTSGGGAEVSETVPLDLPNRPWGADLPNSSGSRGKVREK